MHFQASHPPLFCSQFLYRATQHYLYKHNIKSTIQSYALAAHIRNWSTSMQSVTEMIFSPFSKQKVICSCYLSPDGCTTNSSDMLSHGHCVLCRYQGKVPLIDQFCLLLTLPKVQKFEILDLQRIEKQECHVESTTQ